MAWTTPRTWTHGEVGALAPLYNLQIRDNLDYLYNRLGLTERATYQSSVASYGGGINTAHEFDWIFQEGTNFFDLTDPFNPVVLEKGEYAFTVSLKSDVHAGKTFDVTVDVNNASGPSGFATGDATLDEYRPSTGQAWVGTNLIWTAEPGDTVDCTGATNAGVNISAIAFMYVTRRITL